MENGETDTVKLFNENFYQKEVRRGEGVGDSHRFPLMTTT